jgi:hypothetical protein
MADRSISQLQVANSLSGDEVTVVVQNGVTKQVQVGLFTNAGAVNYQGTWNATTNTPTLASSVGTDGYFYVVSVAGTTTLDGLNNWAVGDWVVFNGTAWNKVFGGNKLPNAALTNSSITLGSSSVSLGGTLTTPTGLTLSGATNTFSNIPNTAITGLGTMSTQNASSVAITGGSIAGTDLNTTVTNLSNLVNSHTTLIWMDM